MISLDTPSNGSFTGYTISLSEPVGTIEPVTLQEAKDYLRVDGNTEDALIQALIKASRKHCESYCGKSLVRKTVTVQSFSYPYQFQVPHGPLESVDDVIKVVTIDSKGNESELQWLANTGLFPKIVISGGDKGEKFLLQYEAGFTVLPEDIKLAILMMTNTMYERREDFSDMPAIPSPIGVKALLEPYITYNWFGA